MPQISIIFLRSFVVRNKKLRKNTKNIVKFLTLRYFNKRMIQSPITGNLNNIIFAPIFYGNIIYRNNYVKLLFH